MTEVGALLEIMETKDASDLFVGVGRPPSLRVNGVTTPIDAPVTTEQSLREFLESILRPPQIQAFNETGDLDVGFTHARFGRFRANFYRQRGLVAAVIRRVPSGQLSFEALGLPPVLRDLAEQSRGLVLVTGSTGSGKSTTLASMVHHINSNLTKHIVTIEDPIEFVHDDLRSLLSQREVGSDTRSFGTALRHVVRESPDVIVIGEMRDTETVGVAISAALTGHLVLSTLHTTDTVQTLQRILGYYPEHLQHQVCIDLSLALQGILSQRLAPKADGQGRIVAVEVLLATPPIRRLIREQRLEEIVDLMIETDGMQTINRALVELYKKKQISLEIGVAYSTSPEEFRMNAQGLERGVYNWGGVAQDNIPAVGKIDMKTLLAVAAKYSASDIHLTVGTPPMFRINGKLSPLGEDSLSAADTRRLLFSLLNQAQRERFELERELDFALAMAGKHRFRVNAHYQRATVAVALRLIPDKIPDMESLGLPPMIKELAMKSHGLVLVTGPTGSGKSTTLATMIDVINQNRNCHIITVEDPIEFVHHNGKATIEQREIGADTRSFAAALKYILRQDPDVILVGEMRDQETISAALTAAETGHLVLATLHTNDAPQTADRIVDVFPPYQQAQIRTQLASALLSIISQRLLLRADGNGRVAAFEILVATAAMRNHIREGKTHQMISTMETSLRDGMVTMDRALADMEQQGVVSQEEAMKFIRNPANIKGLPGAGRRY